MKRLALLACFAIAAAGGDVTAADEGVAAADDDPPRRIALPEMGIALALPTEWDVAVPMIDTTDEAVAASLGAALSDVSDQVRGFLAMDATNGIDYPQAGSGGCFLVASVATEPVDQPFELDELLVAADAEALWTDPGFELTAESELELPIGRVNRVDFVEHDDDGDWFGIGYRFVIPDGLGWLQCVAFESRPDDGWLHVAETLELLPAGPDPAPGFLIEFPESWDVREPDQTRARGMVRAFDGASKPLVRPRLAADAPDGSESCSVIDWSLLVDQPNGYRDMADALTGDILALQRAASQRVVDSALLELPVGQSARVDILLGEDIEVSRWHFTDGDAWFYLLCASREPPDDRWRSIAATFRFE